jgi:hypothetical protein
VIVQAEVTWVVGVVLTIIGAYWALAKMLIGQSQAHIDTQFKAITQTLKAQDEGNRRIERDLMELKAELPRDYVRREDQNRRDGITQVSIDNLRLTIERFMLERTKP